MSTIMHNQRGVHRAFTLIEVLIATFILALGSLGLVVLFAGAATQQQRSTQLDQSVFVSRNAEAMMARRFGSIQFAPDIPTQNRPVPGVWNPLTARMIAGNPGAGVLTIDRVRDGRTYFIVTEQQDVLLYKREADDWTTNGLQVGSVNNPIGTTGYARTLASSMRLQIVIGREPMMGETGGLQERTEFLDWTLVLEPRQTCEPLDAFPPPIPANWPGGAFDACDGTIVFAPGGVIDPVAGQESYLVLEYAVDQDPAARQSRGSTPTPLTRLRVNDVIMPALPGNWVVDEVRLLGGFQYLSGDIISLDDRVIHVPDDEFAAPLAGRPSAAYGLLYRTTTDGGSAQLAAFTYSISGGQPGAKFEPDEESGNPNLDAPLQYRSATLRYDSTLGEYYLVAPPADEWIIAPGQLLLVAGEDTLNPADPDPEDRGADFAVRVLQQRIVGGEKRGYLDRVPRGSSSSILPTFTGSANIHVWAIQPVVENINDSETPARWRLTPQEVRIFQL